MADTLCPLRLRSFLASMVETCPRLSLEDELVERALDDNRLRWAAGKIGRRRALVSLGTSACRERLGRHGNERV